MNDDETLDDVLADALDGVLAAESPSARLEALRLLESAVAVARTHAEMLWTADLETDSTLTRWDERCRTYFRVAEEYERRYGRGHDD